MEGGLKFDQQIQVFIQTKKTIAHPSNNYYLLRMH